MTPAPQEARSIRCQRCGAAFPIPAIAPSVLCPYCHNAQPVPPELLQQLGYYQQQMADRAASVQAADEAAAHARQLEADIGAFQGKRMVAGYLVMFGPACLLQGTVWVLTQLDLIPKEIRRDVEGIVQLASGLLCAVGVVGYLGYRSWRARMPTRSGALAPMAAVVCPGCGAPNVLAPGQIIHACRYCRSALMPTHAVMQRALSAAEAEARRARMRRYRAEREAFAGVPNPSRVVHLLLNVALVLMALAAGYFTPILVLAGNRELAPYAQLVTVAGYILGGLVAVVLVVFIMRDINRQQRWDAIFAALAARLGGQRLDSAMILRWLNTYWAGSFPPNEIQKGPCGGAVACVLDGFPALMIVDAVKSNTRSNDHFPPKVVLLIAATFAGAGSVARGPLTEWLSQQALSPHRDEGGVVARMGGMPSGLDDDEEGAITRLARRPEEALRLAEVLGALARLAAMSGAIPAEAM